MSYLPNVYQSMFYETIHRLHLQSNITKCLSNYVQLGFRVEIREPLFVLNVYLKLLESCCINTRL